jgi:simple sugar transport system permease protein
VFTFFMLFAGDSGMFNAQGIMNWSQVSAQFMIIAVGACMLMIAGEFDLSVGSMIGFAGMMIAIFGVTLGWPIWMAILITFALCMAIGALNGFIVVRTGLPSFIVTLAFLFILRGFTIFLPQTIERKTIIGGIATRLKATGWRRSLAANPWLCFSMAGRHRPDRDVFERGNRAGEPVVDGIPMLIVWATLPGVFGHVVLTRRASATGFSQPAATLRRHVMSGVPVESGEDPDVHVHGLLRHVFATCQVMEFGSAGADRGLLKEFEAIIAVVIGGALLTGGYGSVIGAALGGADLRGGAAGPVLCGRGKLAVPGVPGRHPAIRGDPEHLHPTHDHGGALR